MQEQGGNPHFPGQGLDDQLQLLVALPGEVCLQGDSAVRGGLHTHPVQLWRHCAQGQPAKCKKMQSPVSSLRVKDCMHCLYALCKQAKLLQARDQQHDAFEHWTIMSQRAWRASHARSVFDTILQMLPAQKVKLHAHALLSKPMHGIKERSCWTVGTM